VVTRSYAVLKMEMASCCSGGVDIVKEWGDSRDENVSKLVIVSSTACKITFHSVNDTRPDRSRGYDSRDLASPKG
jgi:hypothetical protein